MFYYFGNNFIEIKCTYFFFKALISFIGVDLFQAELQQTFPI